MELKTMYQYTHFIHPYIVNEKKYGKYILKLIKDKKCSIKFFQLEKEHGIYIYFLPNIKRYMFKSFGFDKNKINEFNKLDKDMQAAILSKNPCTIFEYNIGENAQGKTGEENGIFFKIEKMEIICFKTGVCFIDIKTNIEGLDEFADVLNFNYKFRDIKSDKNNINEYDKIKIQTSSLNDITKFTELIKNITGDSKENNKVDFDTERFLTYSYVCLDSKYWNSKKDFDELQNDFVKFAKVLPNSHIANFNNEKIQKELKVIDTSKYLRYGFTKISVALMASGADFTNYTTLPEKFENEYLYTYILALYSKIYLKKISQKFNNKVRVQEARKDLIKFTQELWIQEITNDATGSEMYEKWKDVLGIDELYSEVKSKYDLMYKDLNIEKSSKTIKMAIRNISYNINV